MAANDAEETTARADLMGILDFFGDGSDKPAVNPSMAAMRDLGMPQSLIDAYGAEQEKNRKMQAMQMIIGGIGNAVSGYQGMAPVAAPNLGASGGGGGGGGAGGIDGIVDRAMKFSQLRAQTQAQQNLVNLRKAIAADPNLTPQQRSVFDANPALYDDVIKAQITNKGPNEKQLYDQVASGMIARGETPPSFDKWLVDYKQSGATRIENRTGLTLNETLAKDFVESVPKVDALSGDIRSIHSARDALDNGIFTGNAAEINQQIAKFGNMIGINDPRVQNTELFLQATAQRVLPIVKNLGTGSGITDADRQFAEKLAAGNIKFEEGTLRRLLDIAEQANRAAIQKHNARAKNVLEKNPSLGQSGFAENLFVQEPEQYKTLQQRAQEELARRRAAAGGNP